MVVTGEPAPLFSLLDHRGRTVSLADFAGKRLLVYFYPRAFTPGCTTEACDLRDRHQAFLQAGWAIVGISPDSPERLARFREKHSLPFPLLSDPDHRVAEAYGAWGASPGWAQGAAAWLVRSWPQAASIPRPRVSRSVTLAPARRACSTKAVTAARVGER